MPELDPYRLPTTVTPSRYTLELAPDLEAFTFAGTVRIEVDVHEPVTEVVLNALELDIRSATIDGVEAQVRLDEASERAFLTLPAPLAVGTAVIDLTFAGTLNDKLKGFYRSTFKDTEGHDQVIATTQMEATFARLAFPCWDEPEAKATFVVSLVVADGLTALSNGAEVGREDAGGGTVRVRFAETMKMSTYLVAFIVGPLDVTDAIDVDGTPLRLACPRGKTHLAPYALDVAEKCLRWFTDYYAIPYPGGKVDLVAVPDFAFGAMENTGCITFREVLLLADPAKSSTPELMALTDVVNHEVAHMWFGNLVTMRWWEGIWLNEAFATFMETKATEAYRPDWNRWVEFALSRSQALETDALDSTRPIEFPVVSPDEAEGMFDILTYEKGGSVLRMLEQYLGEDRFRDGIRHYLSTHAYGNTETTDLWDAIEHVAGEPVRRIMDSWIFQGGHPIVEVEKLPSGSALRLRQERFRLSAAVAPDGPEAETRTLGEVWSVPVVLRASVGGEVREQRVLLETPETDVDLGGEVDWVVVNAGGHGFYRVRYSPDLRAALTAHGIGRLDILERYCLLDDTAAAVDAGALPGSELLALARAYGDETDVAVWKLLASAIATLERVQPEDRAESFAATVRAIAAPALKRLGPKPADDEDDRTRELRGVLLALCAIEGRDADAVTEARRLRDAAIAEPGSVDPALVAASTRIVSETGDVDDFERGVQRWKSATTPQEEVRELYSLGRYRDDALMDRVFDMVLTDVRSQNGPYLLRIALLNKVQGPRVWRWLRQHWTEVNDRFPSNSIVRLLEGITALDDPAVAADVQGFFAEHPVPQGANQLAQHLERQKVAVALRERERASAGS